MCACAHVCACVPGCERVRVHTYLGVSVCTHICACVPVCAYVCIDVVRALYTCVYVCMWLCTCVSCVHVYACACVCVCVGSSSLLAPADGTICTRPSEALPPWKRPSHRPRGLRVCPWRQGEPHTCATREPSAPGAGGSAVPGSGVPVRVSGRRVTDYLSASVGAVTVSPRPPPDRPN